MTDGEDNDLKVIEITSPTSPSVITSIGIGSFPASMVTLNNFAYIVDRNSDDLKIIRLACELNLGIDPTTGNLIVDSTSLSNHIANENISLSDYYISNDGDDEGLSIDDDGNVNFSGQLSVGDTVNLSNALIINGNTEVNGVLSVTDTLNLSDALIISGNTEVNGVLTVANTLNIKNAYQFPDTDGNALQILTTNGSGILSWTDLTDNQTIDEFSFTGDSLFLSLENDGISTYGLDLSSLLDNTDNQMIETFTISNDSLYLSLEDDGEDILRVDLSSISPLSLADTDNDTKIQVEESNDEDIIRFDLNGTEFMRLDNGRIEILNTGESVFIGEGAGENDDYDNNDNVFIGYQSGYSSTSGYENIFTGHQSGYSNTSGRQNTFIGDGAGYNNTTGSYNVFSGKHAGYSNTTGSNNIFLGYQAGINETGSNKLYIDGLGVTSPLIYGEFDNSFLQINGTLSIQGNYNFPTTDGASGEAITTDGSGNLTWSSTIVGTTTSVADADSDTKIQVEESSDEDIIRFDLGGMEFMRLDSGRIEIVNTGNSIFIGEEAGYNDDYDDNNNVFIGYQSGYENTTGYNNIFTGSKSGYENTTGYSNLFLGSSAGRNNTSGYGNIFLGNETGEGNDDGQYNVMIGHQAGTSNTSGDKNIFIGYRAGKNATSSNKLYIDNSATSSPLIYGDFSNDSIQINGALAVTDKITTNSNWISGDGDDEGIFINSDGNIGIGTNSPTQGKLVISGTSATQTFNSGTYGYWSYNGSATSQSSLSNTNYALYTDERIAAWVYHAISDERVKDIKGITNNAADLETLKKIQITDYQFKDKVKNGNATQKKVIAQQVAEVYPQAVTSNTTEVVPNIMQNATMDEKGWISFNYELRIRNYELKQGDKIQILFEDKKELLEVLEVKENTFHVSPINNNLPMAIGTPITIFIYGKQVNDFHTVDYEAISMLNVSATQQLAKEVEQLKEENKALKAQLEKINQLEAMLQQLQARLLSGELNNQNQ